MMAVEGPRQLLGRSYRRAFRTSGRAENLRQKAKFENLFQLQTLAFLIKQIVGRGRYNFDPSGFSHSNF